MDYYILGYGGVDSSTQANMLLTLLRYNGIDECARVNWITGEGYASDVLSSQSINIYNDINNYNPKVILALGSNVAKFLLGEKYRSLSRQAGKILNCTIGSQSYSIILTYSIDYILRNSDATESSKLKYELTSHILQAIKLVSGELSDINSKKLVTALTYQEFLDYYNQNLADADHIAYDIETNAQLVQSIWFKTIGFSLAGSSESGVYVVREALEYKIPDNDWNLITQKLLEILKSKNIIVHNSMYEVPAAVNEYNYRLEEFDDTLVMSRLLLGGKVGAGLKEQCQVNLGYPEWEADLAMYREAMDTLRHLFKPTAGGTEREEFLSLQKLNGDLLELLNRYQVSYDEYVDWLYNKSRIPDDKGKCLNSSEFDELSSKLTSRRDYRLIKAINDIYKLVNDYYAESSEYSPNDIMNLVGQELIILVNSGEFGFLPYSSVPLNLLSRYGAIDAVGTRELYDVLSTRLTSESTEDVDLWRGYEIMKSQFEVGTSMEMNGLYWNDEVANQEHQWFNEQACKAMRGMLLSGYLDEYIFENSKTDWIKYLLENNPEELSAQLGYEFVLISDSGIKKFENGEVKGRKIKISNIHNLINSEYWTSVRDLILRLMKIKLSDETQFTDFNDYKVLYNPASPGQHKVLNPILVDDDIKIANVLQSFYLIIDDLNRTIDEFPEPDRGVFQFLVGSRMYNRETKDWNEEHSNDKRELISDYEVFTRFKQYISVTNFKSKEVNSLLLEGLKFELTSGDEPSLVNLYHLYCLTGINIEDESTWSEQFRFLYNFRMYKKCIKMINSYITGDRVGRGSVAIVNESEVANTLARRVGWYNDGPLKSGQTYIMQPKYGVCSANTLRWTSGQHTIPSTSSIKNIYTSRYPGGVIFAPDYSQMEIRAIAAISGCQTLVQAFIDGMDIHLFNASKIWRKPPEEVTSVERRYAKMSSFSILYGDTPEGFAQKFLAGDESLGRQIFRDFYAAYPEIKEWTEERHREMMRTGKVSLAKTGMFLKVSPEEFYGDESKAKRASGNYPIQSQASNMAGYILSQADKYLRSNNMKTKPILFIHDSLEFDVHPSEMLRSAEHIIHMMNEIPYKEFGIPAKVDLELGVSLGQGLDASEIDISEDGYSGEMVIEGKLSNFELLINQWRLIYSVVDVEELEAPEEIYVPRGDLFVPKLTLSRSFGTYEKLVKCKVRITY